MDNGKNAESEIEQAELLNYAIEYAKSVNNAGNNSIFYNPIWQNELLKSINMSPVKYDRKKVEELIANPRSNEKALRDLAQYLQNYIMQFNKLVQHYGRILTFDYFLEPTNADAEDMTTKKFKKSYEKACAWLESLNPKKILPEITTMCILEDAKFYYVRDSGEDVVLQEMPSAYCKIVNKTELGYQYAFNMDYFMQAGVNINDYAPEFAQHYLDFLNGTDKNKGYMHWVTLDPSSAFAFKFDENRAGQTPPLMGLFVDSVEIASYKNLLKTKTQLDVWKIILNKIPLHKEEKNGNKKDNFAIAADTAGKFSSLMQAAMPEGVKVVTMPLDSDVIDFSNSQNKNDIVGIGQQHFYESAGTSPILFGDKGTNGIGIKASIKTDEAYVMHMYRQFERFINYKLRKVTGSYRFKITFPDITIFNREEKMDMYLKAANFGFPKLLVACALGITPQQLVNLSNFESSLGLENIMKPLISSHTLSGDKEGGASKKSDKDITDEGQKSRDNGSNESDNRV
ncbi:hypothetical protein BC351_10515 [Paenibacillus ferrarius]|uniref:Phage portal protein n=1 Tax=Paenibacillus ferrarius TaxID=1469647 RepID=A0A1V4H8S4_9BACL|nr:hypothetical protein [Paenibacillus ferrarius]OPH47614.1 hypothetical protein BC351_10515 [Paenibacillus ferrarius]